MKRRFRFSQELGRLVEVTPFDEPMGLMIVGDLPGYQSPIDGRCVEGRAQRREDLKRNGCRAYEPSEVGQMMQRRAADDARLEKSVNATVDRWFATSSSRSHELLEQAMRAGAGIDIQRK